MSKEPTEDTKKKLLSHFEYEVRMMIEGFSHIINTGVRAPNSNRINTSNRALIDFLVHTRIFYEFFYKSGRGKDKAHVKHYVNNWKNKNAPKWLEKWNVQINTHLSHMSYARVTGKYEFYPVKMLYEHIMGLVRDFLDELPEKYMAMGLRKLLEDLKLGPSRK